jgi:hypothetical protein
LVGNEIHSPHLVGSRRRPTFRRDADRRLLMLTERDPYSSAAQSFSPFRSDVRLSTGVSRGGVAMPQETKSPKSIPLERYVRSRHVIELLLELPPNPQLPVASCDKQQVSKRLESRESG